MKTRDGFVSNSSSSSFVVGFSKMPKSKEELKKMLFGDEERYQHPYNDGTSYSTWDVASDVFERLSQSKPISTRGIAEELCHGWYEGKPDYSMPSGIDFQSKEGRSKFEKYSQEYEAEDKKVALGIAKQFAVANPGFKFYVFSYSDNNGEYGSAMEHGGLFDRLPCLHISHH